MDSKFITKPAKKNLRTLYLNQFKVKCLFVTIVLMHYNLSSKKERNQTYRSVLALRPRSSTYLSLQAHLDC